MSAIDSTTSGASATTPSATATTNPGLNINETQFLQLMVSQLKDQDPLNASDPTDFVSQIAQLTSVEQETNTATNTQTSEYFALLGHTVTYNDPTAADPKAASTGVVNGVSLTANGATLTVGSTSGIAPTAVTSVS